MFFLVGNALVSVLAALAPALPQSCTTALAQECNPTPYCNQTNDPTDSIFRGYHCNFEWDKPDGEPAYPEIQSFSEGVWSYKCPLAGEAHDPCNVRYFVHRRQRELYCDKELEEYAWCQVSMERADYVYTCPWEPCQ